MQMAPELLEALVVGRDSQRNWPAYGLLAGWMLATVAMAGPTWRLEPNPFAADAQPLMILLKSDESMQRTPPTPSRLERAHLKIADLAKARPGQLLGLIAYAGSAHLVLPPTRDTDVVTKLATEVSPAIMPEPGDRLELAIQRAADLLSSGQQGGSLLVIADSANIDAPALDAIGQLKQSFPIQFLALVDEGSPERESIDQTARSLRATVQSLTVDDADISSVIAFAERRAGVGMAGESSRWQEAGYWATPVIASIVALSFRRQKMVTAEEQS
jgi:Ca-activated chloride channel family protein